MEGELQSHLLHVVQQDVAPSHELVASVAVEGATEPHQLNHQHPSLTRLIQQNQFRQFPHPGVGESGAGPDVDVVEVVVEDSDDASILAVHQDAQPLRGRLVDLHFEALRRSLREHPATNKYSSFKHQRLELISQFGGSLQETTKVKNGIQLPNFKTLLLLFTLRFLITIRKKDGKCFSFAKFVSFCQWRFGFGIFEA